MDENYKLIHPSTYLNKERCTFLFEDTLNHFYSFALTGLRSKHTAEDYFSTLCQCCNYLECDFISASKAQCNRYMNYLNAAAEKGKPSYKTVYKKQSQLANFAAYLENCVPDFHNYWGEIARPEITSQVRPSSIPPISVIDDILGAAEEDTLMYTVISLITKTGLSVKEICHLKVNNFFVDTEGFAGIIIKKRYKDKHIGLTSDLLRIMDAYIKENHRTENDYIFKADKKPKQGMEDKPVTERTLQYRLKKILADAGCPNRYTLQDLRNTAAVLMLKGGADDVDVAETLGIGINWIRRYDHAIELFDNAPAAYTHITINMPKK